MPFSKTFPKTIAGSNYPLREEVFLTEEEEKQAETECQQENFRLLDDSLRQAKTLAIKHAVNTEETLTHLAIALFEKQASHVVFWKESKAKEKLDVGNK